jgi:hypothetical protein
LNLNISVKEKSFAGTYFCQYIQRFAVQQMSAFLYVPRQHTPCLVVTSSAADILPTQMRQEQAMHFNANNAGYFKAKTNCKEKGP